MASGVSYVCCVSSMFRGQNEECTNLVQLLFILTSALNKVD